MIDGYGLLEPIGYGGFSTVYLGRQEIFDRRVAVKVMNAVLADPDAKRRFLRECRVTGRLTGHPNIISVFDAGTTRDGRPYIAMEYVSGGSLADRLADAGRLDADEVLRVGAQVADALVTAHRHGVLHRDLKPANIMIRESGTAVLSDFGIAVVENAAENTTASVAFTPRYASPEVLQGGEHSVASDIFGFGATLFTLLAGQPPFTGRMPTQLLREMLAGPPPALPDELADNVPDELVALVRRTLAAAPDQRPATAAGVLAELRAIEAARGGQVGAPVSADDPKKTSTVTGRLADPVPRLPRPAAPPGGTSTAPTLPPRPGAGHVAGGNVPPVGPAADIPKPPTVDPAAVDPSTTDPAAAGRVSPAPAATGAAGGPASVDSASAGVAGSASSQLAAAAVVAPTPAEPASATSAVVPEPVVQEPVAPESVISEQVVPGSAEPVAVTAAAGTAEPVVPAAAGPGKRRRVLGVLVPVTGGFAVAALLLLLLPGVGLRSPAPRVTISAAPPSAPGGATPTASAAASAAPAVSASPAGTPAAGEADTA
ncbi:serine/threonine-protein kinase, partial [Protofrankia symbiont of Coriaria myrtifolia]|uniref:serine/threonine-protein kinase n=1 Tax=Protofrankia symbiont of Coriaria myrtifolia TaxID=1306540 RepID=UPI001041377C